MINLIVFSMIFFFEPQAFAWLATLACPPTAIKHNTRDQNMGPGQGNTTITPCKALDLIIIHIRANQYDYKDVFDSPLS